MAEQRHARVLVEVSDQFYLLGLRRRRGRRTYGALTLQRIGSFGADDAGAFASEQEAVQVARALARARVLTFSETPASVPNHTAARSRSRDHKRSRPEPRLKRLPLPPAPKLDGAPPISSSVVAASEHTSPQTTAAPSASLVSAAPRRPLQRPAKAPTPETIARLDDVLDCLGPSS
jgi:hypothetical protein